MKSDRDPKAKIVEQLYLKYRKELSSFVQVRTRSSQDVQDIVQDVFYRLSRMEQSSDFLTDESSQLPFLMSVANNLLTDRFRKLHVRKKYGPLPNEEIKDPVDSIGPDRALLAERQIEQVKRVLWKLPEDARRAFVMNRFQYKTYNQIGEELGLPVKRVEKLITKALHALRKTLEASA